MKDPEQMTKHELVQTIYKLAGMNQELFEALKDLSDSIDDGTTLSGQRLENVDKIIAKYKELK